LSGPAAQTHPDSSRREAGFGQRGKLLHFIQGERGRRGGCLDDV
jgi:hypothetical protein